jgi:ankyrin repeat protein
MGANIFISDAQGETPLHRAVASSFTDIVSYLAAKPGACEVTNDAGCTPLSYAASHGRADLVQVLLEYSATDAPVDGCGRTPMFVAMDKGHGSVVDILLSFNPARIRDRDCNGMTLFERAGHAKDKDILRLLRRHARSQGLRMS